MPLNKTKYLFKITALLEGASYLLLLFLAVPLKYLDGDESLVKLLGMPHGLLFIIYIILAFLIKHDENWNLKDFSIIIVASILPFGTFYVDWRYLRN